MIARFLKWFRSDPDFKYRVCLLLDSGEWCWTVPMSKDMAAETVESFRKEGWRCFYERLLS